MKMCMINLWIKCLRYEWSALRFKNSIKQLDEGVYKEYIPSSLLQVKRVAEEVHNRFQYTPDNISHLYDAMDSPASCWQKAFEDSPLKDDCDGFHAALYWAVSFNFDCGLLTVVTSNIKDSHTILYFENEGLLHYVDYVYLSNGFANMGDLINHIQNRRYKSRGTEIVDSELSCWDGNRWT